MQRLTSSQEGLAASIIFFLIVMVLVVPSGNTQTRRNHTTQARPAKPAPAADSDAQMGSPDSLVTKAMHAMLGVREFEQAEISPDGKWVAWVESPAAETAAREKTTSIFISEIAHPAIARRITAARSGMAAAESGIAWSPDSKHLAFLSDAGTPGQLELYDSAIGGGPARRLTNVKGLLADPAWSSDERRLSVLLDPRVKEAADNDVLNSQLAGEAESEESGQQRLALIDAKTGAMRLISPLDLYVYEYDWSPDGKHCVVTAAQGDGEENWYKAGLYSVDTADGATIKLLTPAMQIGAPRWSPDGGMIAFIGGLMSSRHEIGGDIYVIPAAGGEPANVTPGMNVTASWLKWLPDSRRVLFTAYAGGGIGIGTVDVAASKLQPMWQSEETISASAGRRISLSATPDGESTIVIKQSFQHPPELWAGAIGDWKQITHVNDRLESQWGDGESLNWRSGDLEIEGWLIFPRDYDSSKLYPIVVDLHDGPASAVTPVWPTGQDYAMALSAAEYFVLRPNPRGSYGKGEAFVRANVKDVGYGEMKDILAGIDIASKAGTADASRVGITGCGYGGYMAMWAVTQTSHFLAAVVGPGIANFQSYFGEAINSPWMLSYFGVSPDDDPAVYAHSSPLTFIKQVKTPTLFFAADRDEYFPEAQSYEFWRALKRQQVPTRLVSYPGENIFESAAESRQIIERTYAWFKNYFPPFPLP